MNRVEGALRRIACDLHALEVRRAARRDAHRRGYRLDAVVEQDAVGRLATARMITPGADRLGVVVDLLFATAGIEPEVVDSAELLDVLPGVPMPVATVGHLVALKLLARDDETRPQDSGDLRALRPVLGVADRAAARSAAALIVERGFARDRPLVELTDACLTG